MYRIMWWGMKQTQHLDTREIVFSRDDPLYKCLPIWSLLNVRKILKTFMFMDFLNNYIDLHGIKLSLSPNLS